MSSKTRQKRVDKGLADLIEQVAAQSNMKQVAVTKEMAARLKKEKFMFGKKAQADNIALIIVAFFVFAMISLPVYWMVDAFNTGIQDIDTINGTTGGIILQDQTTKFPQIFDGLALFILVGLTLALIGSAFLVDAQPFFFVIAFVIFIFVLILAAILANVWDEVRDTPSLSTLANEFPITNFIFDNYVAVFVLIGMTSFIVLYSKLKG